MIIPDSDFNLTDIDGLIEIFEHNSSLRLEQHLLI